MKSLALFMTLGVSLEGWKKGGWLRRELALYEEHARNGVRIFLVSYGGDEDLRLSLDFPELTVLTNEYRLPKRLYAALLPYLHFRRLKGVDLIKTNQLMGAKQAVTAARLLGVPVVVRQGYNPYFKVDQFNGGGSAVIGPTRPSLASNPALTFYLGRSVGADHRARSCVRHSARRQRKLSSWRTASWNCSMPLHDQSADRSRRNRIESSPPSA